MGGEGATPYEVLLEAAIAGAQRALHPPGRGRGDVEDHAAAARRPTPRARLRAGDVGPGGRGRARGGRRRLARAVGGVVSAPAPDPRRTTAPSPFPPIADYAFLSDCHTGALVAPDGSIDWLCVPRFDAPSVFASLLDRQAGFFRFAPFGINHPTARLYEPGTNVLVTAWKTPSGWVLVRDALTMGPREQRGRDHASHAAAGRRRRRPHAGADGRVPGGPGRDRPGLRAGVRLRAHGGRMDARRRRRARSRRERRRPDDPARVGPRARDRGQPRQGPSRPRPRRAGVLRALVGRGARHPAGSRRRRGEDGRHDALLALLAGAGAHARPPLRGPDPALGARDQGHDLHAHRRDGGRAHDLAARDARRRAQLGLPLHLDARRHLHPAGAALAQPRLGGRRVHAVRRRPRADRGRLAADHVRDRRPPRSDRVHPGRPLRIRGRPARADRQRRLRPAPERRLRRGARLDPAPHPAQQAPAAPPLADRRVAGRVRDEGLARARPGHLGGARRAAALRVVEAHVLGRPRPGGEARRHPRRPGARDRLARDRRGDPRRHPRARRLGGRPAPALRDRRARRLDAAGGDLRLPARHRRAPARDRRRGRRRTHRGRLRPALPDRRDRRRPLGRGGHLPHLLVLARVGAVDRRRAGARPAT